MSLKSYVQKALKDYFEQIADKYIGSDLTKKKYMAALDHYVRFYLFISLKPVQFQNVYWTLTSESPE